MREVIRELELDLRFKPDHDRERRQGAWLNLDDRAVEVGAIEAPVEGDHLPVERVQGAEAEIAVPGELSEADVPFVGPIEQGADRRGLKQHVGLVLGVYLILAKGLDERLVTALHEHQA